MKNKKINDEEVEAVHDHLKHNPELKYLITDTMEPYRDQNKNF